MVVGQSFVWAHLPKAAGDTVAEMFTLFPEIIVYTDDRDSHLKHTWFRDRPGLVEEKQRILCIRRLPSWLLSFTFYKARHGLHPDYDPLPIESPRQMSESRAPDRHLAPFIDEGRRWPDKWIRVEHLVDDFLALMHELTEVSPGQVDLVRALSPVNVGDNYDRNIADWFSPEMILRMYEVNPLWAQAEAHAYADATSASDRGSSRVQG